FGQRNQVVLGLSENDRTAASRRRHVGYFQLEGPGNVGQNQDLHIAANLHERAIELIADLVGLEVVGGVFSLRVHDINRNRVEPNDQHVDRATARISKAWAARNLNLLQERLRDARVVLLLRETRVQCPPEIIVQVGQVRRAVLVDVQIAQRRGRKNQLLGH